jgi:hypothetical protein
MRSEFTKPILVTVTVEWYLALLDQAKDRGVLSEISDQWHQTAKGLEQMGLLVYSGLVVCKSQRPAIEASGAAGYTQVAVETDDEFLAKTVKNHSVVIENKYRFSQSGS